MSESAYTPSEEGRTVVVDRDRLSGRQKGVRVEVLGRKGCRRRVLDLMKRQASGLKFISAHSSLGVQHSITYGNADEIRTQTVSVCDGEHVRW